MMAKAGARAGAAAAGVAAGAETAAAPAAPAAAGAGAAANGRGFAAYLRDCAFEAPLAVLCAWCTACVLMNGFFLDGFAARVPLALAACAPLMATLYLAAYRRSWIPAGIAAFIVLAGALVFACLAASTGSARWDDAEGNYLFFAVIVVAVCGGSFALTRTLPGSVVWFLVCSFSCSVIQAFYETGAVAFSIAAVCLALALVVVRNFRISLLAADSASAGGSGSRTATSLGAVALAAGAALALWFGVIAPLDPGVAKITLVTDYRKLPVIELRGVADEQPQVDLSLTTENIVEGFSYTTDDFLEGESDVLINAQQALDQLASGSDSSEGSGAQSGDESGYSENSLDETYDPQSYFQDTPWVQRALVALALVVALVAAVVALRRARRRKRLYRMLELPPRQQITALYAFILGRLGRLGFTVPAGKTLTEFAEASETRMAALTSVTKVSFANLTSTYTACVYGPDEEGAGRADCAAAAAGGSAMPAGAAAAGAPPSTADPAHAKGLPPESLPPDSASGAGRAGDDPTADDPVLPFVAYYLSFWKAARHHLGAFRYAFKSLRL